MSTAERAVIFDLDGVITDTAEFHYQGWQRLADEHGIPFDRDRNEALRGLARRESLVALLGQRQVDEAALAEMMERKNRYYVDLLGQMTPADALPGAVALVVEAKRRGLRVAIGSSSRNARTVLERLELTDLFDAIVDGDSVDRAKPAPDLFLEAAVQLDVAPERCVVVEDAGSGVDAGLAAGMTVVGVGPPERVGRAQHRFDRVDEIDLAAVVVPTVAELGGGTTLHDGWIVVTTAGDTVAEEGLRYGDRRVTTTPSGSPGHVVEDRFSPLYAPELLVRRQRYTVTPGAVVVLESEADERTTVVIGRLHDVSGGDGERAPRRLTVVADERGRVVADHVGPAPEAGPVDETAAADGFEVLLGRHASACDRWWLEVEPVGAEDPRELVALRRSQWQQLVTSSRAGGDAGSPGSPQRDRDRPT